MELLLHRTRVQGDLGVAPLRHSATRSKVAHLTLVVTYSGMSSSPYWPPAPQSNPGRSFVDSADDGHPAQDRRNADEVPASKDLRGHLGEYGHQAR